MLGLIAVFVCPVWGQGTSGRILGRVADPTAAVLAGVKVTLINGATGATRDQVTNGSGDYSFVEVVPGLYDIQFELAGFKKSVQKGITVDVNQVVTLNKVMEIGATQEVVEITSEAQQVDTTSTQLGAVINDRSVNELPLNTRDTYQFLQLQPGVTSQLGSSGSLFFGSDDAGSVSVNGGRTRANNFSVNGGDANDQFVNLPTIQPTPDSVAEFRMITNTFDAEYGRNSGSVVNVVTKSGTNQFHGDVYEYFRNTVLNAQGYFNTIRPQLNQNQFGGTLGGPIKKDRTFFFVSYEGRRIRSGDPGPVVNVPSAAELGGDFSGVGGFSPPTNPNISTSPPNGISDPFVAQVLNGRPGCTAAVQNLGGQAPAANLLWSQIFPTGVIPTACQDPVAVALAQNYIPKANVGTFQNQSVPTGTDNEDQFTVRVDHKITDRQNISIYYYFTDIRQLDPYNTFEQAGATVPGFGNFNDFRYQQWNISHSWSLTNALVNEAHFTYMREGQLGFLKPQTNNALTASCGTGPAAAFCFTGTSDSTAIPANPKNGITPGLPANITGVPFVSIGGGAEFGNNWEGTLPQVGNSFQWSDNITWVKGNHTFKFGVEARRERFDQFYYFDVNGDYTFSGLGPNAIITGDGDNYAEFLLGLSDTYLQGSGQSEAVRSTSVYPFFQDSWKIKPNLTLNYGLRWELNTPPTDVSGHVETFRPGQNSTIYPCTAATTADFPADCPTGLVVPGDRGVPAGLTSTYYKSFAPRVGLAYSPNFDSGFLGKVLGNKGKTSIRTGWGIFYNPIEELVMAQFGAEPPFGGSTSISNTFLNTPFVFQAGGTAPNPFNGVITPTPGQTVDLTNFRPILLYGEFRPHLRTQYTEQYNLTIQRQLAKDLMLQIGYVGSQGHRLLAGRDINPSTPQTCLDINSVLGAGTCAPTGEDSEFTIPASAIAPPGGFHVPYGPNGPTVIPAGASIGSVAPGGLTLVGLRPYSSPNCNPFTGFGCPADGVPVFSSIFSEDTVASSNYNALEAMLEKRFSRGLQFQASYTYSKSIDDGSTFEETINPFNFRASRALSLFNAAQRFVISYEWELPIPKHQGFTGKVVDDWAVSGITQFQSGFPIRLDTIDDTELIDSLFFLGTEAPSLVTPFQKLNPKTNGGFLFNPNIFQDPPLGQFNNGTQRTICCGPGQQEWDFSVHKKLAVTENTYFQFRAEIFNVFNHTNFSNPDGHFSDGPTEFGKITQSGAPRLVQFALKFYF
ncbi:MAG: carboxypeptidase regulatory-like domain-containing protein [Terriglobales bacterium]